MKLHSDSSYPLIRLIKSILAVAQGYDLYGNIHVCEISQFAQLPTLRLPTTGLQYIYSHVVILAVASHIAVVDMNAWILL